MMNVLFVGLGSIGRRNLDSCLRVRPQYRYAAWKRRAECTQPPSSEPPSSNISLFYSVAEISHFQPDLVWICTPTALHAATLQDLVALKPAVFMEKPLCHTTEDAHKIVTMAQGNNKPFFYGCILRHHPLLRRIREVLNSGLIGKTISYEISCGSFLPDWRPNIDYRNSYSAQKKLGGGVALDLIHEFDYAEFLFGETSHMQGCRTHASSLNFDSDDLCSATLKHSSGVVGHIGLNYFRPVAKRTIEIICSAGLLEGDLLTGCLRISSRQNDGAISVATETHSITRDALHDLQTEDIFATIESKKKSPWDVSTISRLTTKVIDLPWWEAST